MYTCRDYERIFMHGVKNNNFKVNLVIDFTKGDHGSSALDGLINNWVSYNYKIERQGLSKRSRYSNRAVTGR